jgi:hypothetical protein
LIPKPISFRSKVKTRWFQTTFVFLWTLASIAVIGVLTYGLITTPSRIDDLIFILFILIVAVFVTVNYLIWQINGEEVLTFGQNGIELKNQGTFFKRFLRINYFELEQIAYDPNGNNSRLLKFWGISGGKIKIEYLGRKRMFGHDLTDEEAKTLVINLNAEFNKRMPRANDSSELFIDWIKFDDGKTIGATGSEGGIIIEDIEHFKGARITLERRRTANYIVTLGIYGLMFHTHFTESEEKGHMFIELAKSKIEQTFKLLDIPKSQRDAIWSQQFNLIMDDLTAP